MPVPVDGARPASPTKLKEKETRQPEATPLSEPKKRTRPRRNRGKEVAQEGVATNAPQITDEVPWSWKNLTEASASRVPPLTTKDGRYFFTVSGSSVQIYSSTAGQVVSTLSHSESDTANASQGHSVPDAITCAILSPHNAFQLITGSSEGCIRLWNFMDAVLLRTIDIGRPIMHIAAHELYADHVFVSVGRGTKKKSSKARHDTFEENGSVMRVCMQPTVATASRPVQRSKEVLIVGKTRATMGLALSPSGAWIVAIGGHKAYVCPTSKLSTGFTKFVSPQPLTCLAFHPTEDYFATGDVRGIIRLWYCLDAGLTKASGVQRTAQTTTMHWHSHAVSSVAFTANGAYLLSGGEESVLVIWQLHTAEKEFVPRVGAPISHVALSRNVEGEEEYLLALADASFVFVRSGTLKISRSIARIRIDPAIAYSRPSASSSVPLAFHSQSSTIIIPSSHPSSLQVCNPRTSQLVSELEVSSSNRVGRTFEEQSQPSRVEHAVVSDDGEWLATVDYREPTGPFHVEVHLKIWWWDHKSESWILNTRIERPHALTRVSALAFRPKVSEHEDLFLITVGGDGNIKSWGIRTQKVKSGIAEAFWVARSILRYRSEVPTHVSWSADGSLFAVSVGPHVALYDGNTNTLHQVLTCSDCQHATAAHFVGTSSRCIAVVGHNDVMVWDLLTRSLRWRYVSPHLIDRVVVHPTDESFAVFSLPNTSANSMAVSRIVILRSASPVPTATRTLPFSVRAAISSPSFSSSPSDPSSYAFVGITNSWGVNIFGDGMRLPDARGSSARGLGDEGAAGPSRRTLFHDIFGASALVEPTSAPLPVEIDTTHSWRGKEIAEIFDAPTHLMPPVASLFDALVDSFLAVKPANGAVQPEEAEDEERQDEDVEMEDRTEPVLSEERIERVVDRREMRAFVDLFSHCAVKGESHVASPTGLPRQEVPRNGFHHANGNHKPHANGSTPATPSTTKTNGAARSLPTPQPTPTPAPPPALVSTAKDASSTPSKASPAVKAGQKRKKSLG
ncbi:hypothetical protein FOMPIDRAFT_1120096 [Fomitopsis schrenkii]|uniref:WD repeat-containing protein 75 second beta-propeller domain-containing protein n=1 Tax=Fomitopsis schrenkii TaxID=2126942 RepID=S8EA25_FOMSC|nr:hypothetical protein FOMPIDRAFT_1120096 [Fomitopsis schrenkii]